MRMTSSPEAAGHNHIRDCRFPDDYRSPPVMALYHDDGNVLAAIRRLPCPQPWQVAFVLRSTAVCFIISGVSRGETR